MTNSTGCRYISNEEVHEMAKVFKEMEYEARIQELEQKLRKMTESRDMWRDCCRQFKTLADKMFSTEGVKL